MDKCNYALKLLENDEIFSKGRFRIRSDDYFSETTRIKQLCKEFVYPHPFTGTESKKAKEGEFLNHSQRLGVKGQKSLQVHAFTRRIF